MKVQLHPMVGDRPRRVEDRKPHRFSPFWHFSRPLNATEILNELHFQWSRLIQRPVKHPNPLNVEREAASRLSAFLEGIPSLRLLDLQSEPADRSYDLFAHISFADRPLDLVCEVKANGQPRFIRDAILRLRHYLQTEHSSAIPIVIAPYLSEQARQLCQQERVGFLDFEGNAHIAFDTVFIERLVAR